MEERNSINVTNRNKLRFIRELKRLLTILLLLQTAAASATGEKLFYTISGTVSNPSMEPVAYVDVSVVGQPALNTRTDLKGHYTIRISEGSYELVFSMSGYKTLKIPVTVKYSDVVQNCILEPLEVEFSGYSVKAKKYDPSEDIIRKVIEGKHRYLNTPPYTADAYIKATETGSKSRRNKPDTAAGVNMAEVYLTVHMAPPNKVREERKGVEIRGISSGLFYLSHTEGHFNFYRNLIELPGLSQSPFLSPLSNSGLIAYKYKLLRTWVGEDGIRLYRIRVTPGLMGNALLSGELVVRDSLWNLQSLHLSFPKYHLNEYDRFEMSQTFTDIDSVHLVLQMEFSYEAKYGNEKSSGRTAVYYSNFQMQQVFTKKFFKTELSRTVKEAYERDTGFWKDLRKEPLTPSELAFIRRTDSLKAVQSQKSWQDSADRVLNRITLRKLFLTGQAFYKRSEERIWEFKPLLFVYTPFWIAGPRVSYWVTYEKTPKNKKMLIVTPTANMGLLNMDLKGSLNLFRLYDPFRRASYNVSAGSDFGVINPFNSWIRTFRRDNFYAHDYVQGYHRIELLNGFYLGTGLEFADRRSIADMKFDERGDSLWGGNTGLTEFEGYKALYTSLNLYFTPFQKYIREPYQKLILGSAWPEFSVKYRKGWPVMGSTVDFDYLEFGLEQELKAGLAGISRYRVVSGEFFNTRNLQLVDNVFQRSIGPFFFANPLYAFQGIDTSYATIQRFFEGHYFHRFNGALLNKVPLLKKLGLSECAGGGILLTTERNMRYLEAFVGLEKTFKIFKERVRLGVFYVANVNNLYSTEPQFKFTIEVYDKVRNRWPY